MIEMNQNQYGYPGPGMMPPFPPQHPGMPPFPDNYRNLETKVARLERQVKRLEERVSRLENLQIMPRDYNHQNYTSGYQMM